MTVIAIDGPAASGKSSVARRLAEQLHCTHVNSGSLYRAATWSILNAGINPGDETAVTAHILRLPISTHPSSGSLELRINGQDPQPFLRDSLVNEHVSTVSSYPEVRRVLTGILRSMAENGTLVMEGRDIGSVVFPETPWKLYIDASEEVRAARRAAQGETDSIRQRDKADQSRPSAPLVIPSGAALIDNSLLNPEETFAAVCDALASRGFQGI
jgi:cytidylate kinase